VGVIATNEADNATPSPELDDHRLREVPERELAP
jgi:hypothetical protein